MTNRLELNWKVDGFVDEQRYYCSENPIDLENLPVPKAILAGDVWTYIDTAIEKGRTYYLAIGSVKNGIEKLSDQVEILAGVVWNPFMLASTPQIFINSDIFSSYLDDIPVTAWDNIGSIGGSFSQAVAASKPTLRVNSLNGYPVVHFNGSSNLLNMSSFAAGDLFRDVNKAWSFTVSKCASSGLSSILDARTGGNAARFLTRSSSTQMGVSSRRLDSESTAGRNVLLAAGYNISCNLLDYQSASLRIRINGFDQYNGAHGTAGSTSNTASQDNNLSIGNRANSPAAGEYFSGDIVVVIAGSGFLPTLAEFEKLEGWAAHKYGLTANLPSGHPYKTLVPTI